MLILHGENTVQSRAKLGEVLQEARARNVEVTRLTGKKLTLAELEEALVSTSLFGSEQMVVIDELHALPKSKRKDELIALLAQPAAQSDSGISVVLWEARALTATMLKKFPGARAQEFKSSKPLFQWLDSLGGKNPAAKLKLLHQSLATDGEHFCFLMLIRQIRLLIQVTDGGTVKGAPFMITKLQRQAHNFTLDQLLKTHAKLLEIDRQMKRSEHTLSLSQQLDLLTLSL